MGMEERDKIRYEILFYCQKLESGFLSGDTARALFIRSKLPLLDLTRIWKLSDITRDNKLDVFEFSLAMHFIELKLTGGEIPKQNDIPNVDNNVKEVLFPKITLEEKQQIKDIFEYADTNSQDFLEMNIVIPMLLTSGLPPSTLSRIWNIADLDRDGKLCLLEFTIAMHLVKNCVKGLNLSGPVNPFACFPDEDDAIRLFKEKLAIFDKEFLLKQTQEDNEEELFLNSIDSAECADFELLVVYLFDGIHDSTPDEHEPDFVDDNRNIFKKQRENVSLSHFNDQHDVLADSEDCDSVAEETPRGYTMETVESRKINKNILDVDLENIFETVIKENMDESEAAPKFIAKPAAVCYTETEEDDEEEDPVVLSYFQRRQYMGKDLVFEDPIGSEIIGDVEFEVDFDYIINDIEKEIVDEERRLPIARVLPIYKTPPVSDEQILERTMITKGGKEIDLNFIDVKAGGFHEQENRGLNRREKDLLINSMTKESQISSQGIVTNEELKNKKSNMSNISNNTRVKNSNNFDNVNGATEDIVEQKRLLLQSQQEERRKFRENRLKDNEIKDQHSELSSSIPVLGNAADETSDPKQDCNKNVKEPYSNNTIKSNNENQFEDEEEKKRLREAEDKEKRLLERIKFLEKRRQQIYEQKQRELNSKNITRKQEEKLYVNHSNRVDEKNNQLNVKETPRNNQEQNSLISTSPYPWSSRSKQRKENDEEEKRRLAEALAAKRRTEAELERQREEVLREAEKRRLEEEAKKQEEQEEAKERKRHFLENLQRLKQRVITEEEEKSNSQSKREPNRSVHSSFMTETPGKLSGSFGSSHSQSVPGYTKRNDRSGGTVSSNVQKNVPPLNQTNKTQHEADVERQQQARNVEDVSTVKHENANVEKEEDQEKADEMRRQNFKSNRELFMKKIQNEEEQCVPVRKRENSKKVRPKSFYGGMFNKPVHQIIDDSLLEQNVDSASAGDLVDEEALKQFQREQELKKEHEKVNKLRQSLERESSYTVENVEQLFRETDSDSKEKAKTGTDWDHVERREAKTSSHPHRRSLVNTLTTEWNSFIDVLEDDKRWEHETVKMRQDISAQRKASPARTSKTVNLAAVDVVKSDCSKENVEEKEIFAKQAGKVKKLVKSYKRLSVPCFLDQDHCTWNIEKSEEETKPFETTIQTERSSTSHRQEPDDKKFDSKTVIKENAPKRKTDLAHAWSNMISNQQQPD